VGTVGGGLVESTLGKRGSRFVFVPGRTARRSHSFGASPTVSWRLLAPNNRSVGRSAEEYTSTEQCQAAAELLTSEHSHLCSAVVVDSDGRWRWTVSLDGRLLAESPTGYFRRLELNRAMTLFLTTMATVAPALEVPSWSRRPAAVREALRAASAWS
jgi:uncharacterized protein YegP (UPF0339 family)